MPNYRYSKVKAGTRESGSSGSFLRRPTRPFTASSPGLNTSGTVIQRLTLDKLLEAEDPMEYMRKKMKKYAGHTYSKKMREQNVRRMGKMIWSNKMATRYQNDPTANHELIDEYNYLKDELFGESNIRDYAGRVKKKGWGAKVGEKALSGTKKTLETTEVPGIGSVGAGVMDVAAGQATGGALSVLSAVKSGRQALRAGKRAAMASHFKQYISEHARGDDARLREIVSYVEAKQGRRAARLTTEAGLDLTTAGAAITTAATGGTAAPATVPIMLTSLSGKLAIKSGVGSKALYKKIKGTKGKKRRENAEALFDMARSGHQKSRDFLEHLGVLKGLPNQPGPRFATSQGRYGHDELLNATPKDRAIIVKYIMQKMRS